MADHTTGVDLEDGSAARRPVQLQENAAPVGHDDRDTLLRGGEKAPSRATWRCALAALILAIVSLVLWVVAGAAIWEHRGIVEATRAVILSNDVRPPAGYEYAGSLHAGSGEWVHRPSLPSARSDLGAAAHEKHIFVAGGTNGSVVLDDVLVLDTVFDVWEPLPGMPTPRYRFALAAVGDFLVAAGGYTELDGPSVASCDIFNRTSGQWVAGPPLSTARGDVAVAAARGKVFVIGGYAPDFSLGATGQLVESLDVEAWASGQATAWTVRAPMPTARGDAAATAFAHGHRILVAGGWNDEFLAAVEEYDVEADAWTELPPMPVARGDKAIGVVNGEVVVAGGEVWSGDSEPCPWDPSTTCAINEIPLHEVDSIDLGHSGHALGAAGAGEASDVPPSARRWVPRAPMPEAAFRFAGAAVDNELYVIGGQTTAGQVLHRVSAFMDIRHPNVYIHHLVGDEEEED